MKSVITTFLLLIGIGWFTATVETPKSAPTIENFDSGQDSWRRTTQGWENANTWQRMKQPRFDIRAIHPTIVAVFTFLACLGGLIAYCPSWADSGSARAATKLIQSLNDRKSLRPT